jgi:CheY-like chemotaxis protein
MSRILVVDDEPMVAALLADWLEELGHETIGPAYNAASALAMISAGTPDAAIVDVSLGRETGYPIAERLHKLDVPFAFATGHAEESLSPQFTGRRIIAKPFDFEALRTVVDEMIGSSIRSQTS